MLINIRLYQEMNPPPHLAYMEYRLTKAKPLLRKKRELRNRGFDHIITKLFYIFIQFRTCDKYVKTNKRQNIEKQTKIISHMLVTCPKLVGNLSLLVIQLPLHF